MRYLRRWRVPPVRLLATIDTRPFTKSSGLLRLAARTFESAATEACVTLEQARVVLDIDLHCRWREWQSCYARRTGGLFVAFCNRLDVMYCSERYADKRYWGMGG